MNVRTFQTISQLQSHNQLVCQKLPLRKAVFPAQHHSQPKQKGPQAGSEDAKTSVWLVRSRPRTCISRSLKQSFCSSSDSQRFFTKPSILFMISCRQPPCASPSRLGAFIFAIPRSYKGLVIEEHVGAGTCVRVCGENETKILVSERLPQPQMTLTRNKDEEHDANQKPGRWN